METIQLILNGITAIVIYKIGEYYFSKEEQPKTQNSDLTAIITKQYVSEAKMNSELRMQSYHAKKKEAMLSRFGGSIDERDRQFKESLKSKTVAELNKMIPPLNCEYMNKSYENDEYVSEMRKSELKFIEQEIESRNLTETK